MCMEHSGILDGSLLENEVTSTQKPLVVSEAQKRIYDTKWASLEKLGYKKPATFEENKRRAKQAHMR